MSTPSTGGTRDRRAARGRSQSPVTGRPTSPSAIANRLGLSRRALYDAIRGRPTGSTCPACGAACLHQPLRVGTRPGHVSGLRAGGRRRRGGQSATDTGLTSRPPSRGARAGRRGWTKPKTGPWAEPDATIEQEWDAGRLAPIAADAAYRLDRALLLGGGRSWAWPRGRSSCSCATALARVSSPHSPTGCSGAGPPACSPDHLLLPLPDREDLVDVVFTGAQVVRCLRRRS